MKAKFSQNDKLKSINDLKDELLKNLRGSQPQKPKTNQGNLNNSTLGSKYNNPIKSSSPGKFLLYIKIKSSSQLKRRILQLSRILKEIITPLVETRNQSKLSQKLK